MYSVERLLISSYGEPFTYYDEGDDTYHFSSFGSSTEFTIQIERLDLVDKVWKRYGCFAAVSSKYAVFSNNKYEQIEFYSRKSGRRVIILDVWFEKTYPPGDRALLHFRDDGLIHFETVRPDHGYELVHADSHQYFDANQLMKERVQVLGSVFNSNFLRNVSKYLFL